MRRANSDSLTFAYVSASLIFVGISTLFTSVVHQYKGNLFICQIELFKFTEKYLREALTFERFSFILLLVGQAGKAPKKRR